MALKRGTAGNDTLDGTARPDLIFGLDGNDVLSGLDGDDIIYGGNGADQLFGGNGDDFLIGGNDFDSDLLDGGAGNDVIVARFNDIITGGDGFDTLMLDIPYLAGNAATLMLDFSGIHRNTPWAFGFGSATAASIERVELGGAIGHGSVITGSRGTDIFAGFWIDNIGTGAAVTINGGGGNDLINGSSRNDVLRGGAGDDMLAGDEGNDRLTGGAGEDIFILADKGRFFDRITDFEPGKDALLVGHIDPETGFDFQFLGLDLINPLVTGSDPLRNSPAGQFLYDTDDGRLYFDNGSGADLVAILVGAPVITMDDFLFATL